MKRMAIRRLGLWSVFKFSVVAYLVMFLISFVMLLAIYLVLLIVGAASVDQQTSQAFQNLGVSGGVFLLLTFFGGILGSIVSAAVNWFAAVIYNLLAMMTGGIEVKVEETGQGQAGVGAV